MTLTAHDVADCGLCAQLDRRYHTRLGLPHRWLVGDPIAIRDEKRVLTVTAIVDHGGDHFVAVFLPTRWSQPLTSTTS